MALAAAKNITIGGRFHRFPEIENHYRRAQVSGTASFTQISQKIKKGAGRIYDNYLRERIQWITGSSGAGGSNGSKPSDIQKKVNRAISAFQKSKIYNKKILYASFILGASAYLLGGPVGFILGVGIAGIFNLVAWRISKKVEAKKSPPPVANIIEILKTGDESQVKELLKNLITGTVQIPEASRKEVKDKITDMLCDRFARNQVVSDRAEAVLIELRQKGGKKS